MVDQSSEAAAPNSIVGHWAVIVPSYLIILATNVLVLSHSPWRLISPLTLLPNHLLTLEIWVLGLGLLLELALSFALHVSTRLVGGQATFMTFWAAHMGLTTICIVPLVGAPWAHALIPLSVLMWGSGCLLLISHYHRLAVGRSLFAWLLSLPMQLSFCLIVTVIARQMIVMKKMHWEDLINYAHRQALMGHENIAEHSLLKALTAASAYNNQSADTARLYYELGVFYESLSRLTDAKMYYAKAEPLLLNNFGLTSRPYWDCVVRQAEMAEHEGRWSDAEDRYRKLLQSMDYERGSNHPFSIGYLNALGRLAYAQGHFNDAETYYLQALQIADGISIATRLGSSDFRVTLVNSLAFTYAAEGKGQDLQALLASRKGFPSPLYYQTTLWNQWKRAAALTKDPQQAQMWLKRCTIISDAMPSEEAAQLSETTGSAAKKVPGRH